MPNPDPARTTTLFCHSFRPFFLFAGIYAGAGWCLAFAVFTVVYWPILTRPRADGRA